MTTKTTQVNNFAYKQNTEMPFKVSDTSGARTEHPLHGLANS